MSPIIGKASQPENGSQDDMNCVTSIAVRGGKKITKS